MEFREYGNPESADYDIKSSLSGASYNVNNQDSDKYLEELLNLIGILEDIPEDVLNEEYGISIEEYFNPTAETIRKVSAKLNSAEKRRNR